MNVDNGADFNLVKGEIESYEMEEMTRGDTEERLGGSSSREC